MILSKGAILAASGAVLLGGSLALSSVVAASGAGGIQPDKSSSCIKKAACAKTTNGKGTAFQAVSLGASSNNAQSALQAAGNGLGGLYAYSTNESGAWVENGTDGVYNLFAESDASGGYPFAAFNSSSGTYFSVDGDADGVFDGSVTASTYYTAERTRDGGRVEAFSAQSTRATIEDSGTARMMNGEAAVRFDPAFARTIDTRSGYQVFLTPDGDTRGLYISAKYQGGFIVRETEHGRSSIDFDYRVLAHRYGATEEKLPQLNLRRPSPATPNRVQ
jgi:hypothetical protein